MARLSCVEVMRRAAEQKDPAVRYLGAYQRDSWPWKRGELKRSSTSTMAP